VSGGFFEGVALTDGVAYLAVDCRRCKAIEQRWPLKSQRQSQSQSNQRRMSDERCKLLQHCTPNGIIIIVSGGASVGGRGGSHIIMASGEAMLVGGARVVWQMGK